MIKALATLSGLFFAAGFVVNAVPHSAALAFEKGQRWSCVTDQGADAFLEISDVQGDAVSFSWGVLDSGTKQLDPLCNKRDALSITEMREFCRLLGDEFSEGHVMLKDKCEREAKQ